MLHCGTHVFAAQLALTYSNFVYFFFVLFLQKKIVVVYLIIILVIIVVACMSTLVLYVYSYYMSASGSLYDVFLKDNCWSQLSCLPHCPLTTMCYDVRSSVLWKKAFHFC